jgi:hypothetical protein
MEEGMSVYSTACPFKSCTTVSGSDCCSNECEAYDKDNHRCQFVATAEALEILANNMIDELKKNKETP